MVWEAETWEAEAAVRGALESAGQHEQPNILPMDGGDGLGRERWRERWGHMDICSCAERVGGATRGGNACRPGEAAAAAPTAARDGGVWGGAALEICTWETLHPPPDTHTRGVALSCSDMEAREESGDASRRRVCGEWSNSTGGAGRAETTHRREPQVRAESVAAERRPGPRRTARVCITLCVARGR